MKFRTQTRLCVVLCVLCIVSAGCGRNPYRYAEKVTGTVTCNGKPAAGGIIYFQPVDDSAKTKRPRGEPGPSSVARIEADGTFTLIVPRVGSNRQRDGALIGPHQVTFQVPRTTNAPADPEVLRGLSPEEAEKEKERVENLPLAQALECGNGITPSSVEVKAGANKFDFTLQPGAPASEEQPMTGRQARRQRAREAVVDTVKPP